MDCWKSYKFEHARKNLIAEIKHPDAWIFIILRYSIGFKEVHLNFYYT